MMESARLAEMWRSYVMLPIGTGKSYFLQRRPKIKCGLICVIVKVFLFSLLCDITLFCHSSTFHFRCLMTIPQMLSNMLSMSVIFVTFFFTSSLYPSCVCSSMGSVEE